MEQGNEGDEILFFTCRSIGCDLPAKLQKVGELSAEQLIEIITKALALISNGEIQLSSTLPSNIAVRHRICTDLSIKIKDLGFLGECGYNQLLYPVEHQTRELLKFIIEKVPRTHEEGVEEILGANALLNRNILHALQDWQKSLWHLPSALHGKPPCNKYKKIAFHQRQNLASTLLNRHAMEKVIDTQLTEKMNRKFTQKDSNHHVSSDDAILSNENTALFEKRLIASLKEVEKKTSSTHGDIRTGDDLSEDVGIGGDNFLTAEAKTAAQMNLSFQELIRSITTAAQDKGKSAQ